MNFPVSNSLRIRSWSEARQHSGRVTTVSCCYKTYFLSSQVKFPIVSHTHALLITFAFQIQTGRTYSDFLDADNSDTATVHHTLLKESVVVLSAVCIAQLMKPSKILPLGESCGVPEDVLCCENE